MKRIQKILAVFVFVIMTLSLPAFASDKDDVSNDEILKAAKRYSKVVPMSKLVEDGIREMAQRIQPEKRDDFITNMKGVMRADILEKIALDSMVKIFTAEELNALADFYGSVLGKSIMNKFGKYMAEVMPVLQQEMIRSLQKLQEEGKLQ